jgi:hypothetical protein
MQWVEVISAEAAPPTRQQRWSHLLTLLTGAAAFLLGLNMHFSALNATSTYSDVQAGIRVQYPQRWMVDFEGDYVFRARDMSRVGFKTTISVSLLPIGANTTEYMVLNSLNITRPETMAGYRPLPAEPFILPDETEAVAMRYSFVDIDANPYLVSGLDVLTVAGGQVIIISFLADAQTYDQDIAIFHRFLENLEY